MLLNFHQPQGIISQMPFERMKCDEHTYVAWASEGRSCFTGRLSLLTRILATCFELTCSSGQRKDAELVLCAS